MAHENIEERRLAVLEIISNDYLISDLKDIAIKFNCTYTSVRADVLQLNKKDTATVYPSPKTKEFVLLRDNYTCQYCGITDCKLIVDHVIPSFKGGLGYSYNLVASCNSCNMKKKNKAALPNNHMVLKNENEDWYNKIISSLNGDT